MMIRRILRWGVRAGLILLAVTTVYVGVTFVQVWNASVSDHRDPSQTIIVLGAAQYNGRPSPALRNRLDHAIALYQAGVAPTIVVTGGKQPGDAFTEAATGYSYLRDQGVPEFAILREEQGANTWEELAATVRFLGERGMNSAVLVSSDYHAYRVDQVATELGLDAQVSPVGSGLEGTGRLRALGRETAAVAVGRVIGFRRLVNLGEQLSISRSGGPNR